ncbi:MAG: YdbL family protein [Burkholderiales bacterium]
MKKFLLTLVTVFFAASALAAADIEINSPAINALKSSMQARHGQLAPHYASGAIGLTREGTIALRDANAVPLAQRQAINSMIAAENQDRNALYREIARANKHPEWENEIRSTFASRWVDKAASGWWYQNASGAWAKK